MNRAITITKFAHDFAPNLAITSQPRPIPAPGHVLVRMTCRPINPADLASLMGVYPGFQPASLPAVPGLEGCGVLEDVGDSGAALGLHAGQRVVALVDALHGNGSWQDYVTVPATHVLPIPDSVSDAAAAQFLVNPVTVLGLLDVLGAPEGAYIAQSAAGSTLGRMLIAVAKHRGLKTINLVRREAQVAELEKLGAEHVFVYPGGDNVPQRVEAITGGKKVWGAVDAVAGETTQLLARIVRNGGKVLVYGRLSGLTSTIDVPDVLFRGVSVHGFWLASYLQQASAEKQKEVFGAVMGLMAAGAMVPHTGQEFPLEQIKEAIAKSVEVGRDGKVLLVSK
jgi:NADPH:quinone reductase-like Zn-dependent oxidoreductase